MIAGELNMDKGTVRQTLTTNFNVKKVCSEVSTKNSVHRFLS